MVGVRQAEGPRVELTSQTREKSKENILLRKRDLEIGFFEWMESQGSRPSVSEESEFKS